MKTRQKRYLMVGLGKKIGRKCSGVRMGRKRGEPKRTRRRSDCRSGEIRYG